MQMTHLTEIGRWLLAQPNLKAKWGATLWQAVFDACGSPAEWQEFVARYRGEPQLFDLWSSVDAIVKMVEPPRSFSKQGATSPDPF